MGPVEVIVVGFPGSQFNGEILPALEDLVRAGTISVVDGLLVTKGADGTVTFTELDETDPSPDVAALAALVHRSVDLVSAEDAEALAADLGAGDSAAVLVFEHTWAIPFKDAVVGSGGVLLDDFLVPGAVVDEVLAAVAELD